MFCWPSLLVAEEPSFSPRRALATASGGMLKSVTMARPIPTQLASGLSSVNRDLKDSMPT
jgi:hypothetical protein